MNSRQKEGFAASLRDEKAILRDLEKNYTKALADIKKNIRELQANPLTQSKAYQLGFQRQLERQLEGILDVMAKGNFSTIDGYLNTCYQQGFFSTMYDLQGQGVPLVIPIDQDQVLKSVSKTGDNIKLSNKVGTSTKQLKRQVLAEIQRGFATQMSYTDIARNISSYGQADMNRSMLIARTEGHRVQNEAKMDALRGVKDRGADVVKQWDATFDSRTRESHAALDGQIREIDEPFNSPSGRTAMHPGAFGDPAEDCNCRCAMLQRARWAVAGETSYQKWNNETGGIIECSGYDDFKRKYLQVLEESDIIHLTAVNGLQVNSISVHTLERAQERGIPMSDIIESFKNPIHIGDIVTDDKGRKSQRFIGEKVTANVNPDSGKVTTVWKTGKAIAKKYKKKGG